MRKIVLAVFGVCLITTQLAAQRVPFGKGYTVVNLGVGLGSTWYSGTYYHTRLLPLSASVEFGLADYVLEKGAIGAGPYIGYTTLKNEYNDGGYNYSMVLMGLRGNFHYPLVDNLDTYASLFLGYNIISSEGFGIPAGPPESGGLRTAFYVGGRYYFMETLAFMAEIGYGISYLNVGIAFTFF